MRKIYKIRISDNNTIECIKFNSKIIDHFQMYISEK